MSLGFTPVRKLLLGAVATAAFAAVAPLTVAQAQPAYGPYSYQGDGNQITVYTPRHLQRDYATGAPIDVVQESRVVYYDDLNLDTPEGAHMLRTRIANAATQACDDLDNMYATLDSESRSCFRRAYSNAMAQTPVADYGGSRWRGGY